MKVRELINSCQNQYKDLIKKNKKFLFTVYTEKGTKTYTCNYLEEEAFMEDFWNKEVIWWEARSTNELFISVVSSLY